MDVPGKNSATCFQSNMMQKGEGFCEDSGNGSIRHLSTFHDFISANMGLYSLGSCFLFGEFH